MTPLSKGVTKAEQAVTAWEWSFTTSANTAFTSTRPQRSPGHEVKLKKCTPRKDLETTESKHFISQSSKPKQNIGKSLATDASPYVQSFPLCVCLSLSIKRHHRQGLPYFTELTCWPQVWTHLGYILQPTLEKKLGT